jgi:hypothetical protein
MSEGAIVNSIKHNRKNIFILLMYRQCSKSLKRLRFQINF